MNALRVSLINGEQQDWKQQARAFENMAAAFAIPE
jgi:hypothetical protein